MNPRAIHLPSAIIGSISVKAKNQGISFRVTTPELTNEQKVAFMELQDAIVDLLIQPQDEEFPETVEVKGELDKKPLHVRLRGALWVLAQKMGKSNEECEQFYRSKMEGWIEQAKEKIQEYES